MNYYFINGPALTEVTERYTRLTGTPEMPPLWALGYHQCRWSYYPDSRVRELAAAFREKQIPCDALYLDIDYMDDYRVFTWDEELFPDPEGLIRDLKEQGFETIVMINPGVKVDNDYELYRQGRDKGYFCTRPDGEMVIAPVWPPECAFPDFTNPEVRAWWGGLYEDLMARKKVSGIWNDMNEPAVFEVESKTFPNHVRHDFDGHPCSHKKAHNIYGMQMARASLEGMKKQNPDKRPFLLTRANFAGGQRYAALWTGDNIATWDHLRLASEQSIRLSISGYSFVGSDVGGFVEKPSAELFTRWLQLAIFHPLFRNHTMGYNVDGAAAVKKEEVELRRAQSDTDQEPWVFGDDHTAINRSMIELRYRLLHYLYTAFYHYVQQGTPILRPLSYYDQSDEQALSQKGPFLFGDDILVAPVLEPGTTALEVYFPEGGWYDFRTGERYEGRQTHQVEAPLEAIPFFVRAGAVLPLREVMQHTQERALQQLELNVYYGEGETTSRLYEDAGEGYDYESGAYRLTTFRQQGQSDRLSLSAEREGDYELAYAEVEVTILGLPFEPSAVHVDGRRVPLEKTADGDYTLYLSDPDFKEVDIK
ncbi:TIM-barrel domain-containing protein [Fodinibius sediminis]|nr:TIM-barrel domain-containing protein [Fodinibius sediminis]